MNREYFDRYIKAIEIPDKNKQYISPQELFDGTDSHTGSKEERFEDLYSQVEKELNIAFDRIEQMSGLKAKELLRQIEVTLVTMKSSKELIIDMISDYDEGKRSAESIIDYITNYIR